MSSPTTKRFEAAAARSGAEQYVLRLYIVNATTATQRAIRNLRRICEEELQGRYSLEVIDIYEHPVLAADAQIIAAPTLVKELPLPVARIVGDLSDRDRVLHGLGVIPRKT